MSKGSNVDRGLVNIAKEETILRALVASDLGVVSVMFEKGLEY
jgi:hypothetical protein